MTPKLKLEREKEKKSKGRLWKKNVSLKIHDGKI